GPASYRALLDPAEQPLRTEQDDHDQDQQRYRHSILRRKVSSGEIVDHPEQQAADDRSANLVEATDDRGDEGVEAQPLAVRELGQVDRRDQQRGEGDERGIDQEGVEDYALDRKTGETRDGRVLRARL